MKVRILRWKRAAFVVLLTLLLSLVGVTNVLAQTFTVGNLNYTINGDGASVTLTGLSQSIYPTGEGFENGIPSDWVTIDNDEDGSTWFASDGYAISNSYYSDDYLITNSMSITNNTILRFYVNSCYDRLRILISTSSQTNLSDYSEIANWYACESTYMMVDLSDYAGQTGYIAFYHNGYNNYYGIGIDDVFIGELGNMELNIPENVTYEGVSYNVTTIGDGAFQNCSYIVGDLVIPNTITSIGRAAFANCTGLTSLTIGTGVVNIGGYNQWYLYQNENPFYNCSGITTLNFNAVNCYYVPIEWYGENGHSPFAYLSSLTTLNIGESVQVIPPFAFDGCTGLTGTINIPNSVTEVGPEAFKNCSGFTGTLTIPESVVTIGGGAFDGCSGLSGTLAILPNVTSIGPRAFAYTGIETVNFNAINCEDIGYYYRLYAIPGYYEYEYREGCAFEGCENLTTLVIGNGVQQVPAAAFSGCSSLSGSLLLPESVIEIGGSAFYGCFGFTGSLLIPDAVTYISWSAFEGCTGLDGTVALGESLQCVAENAFANTNFTAMNYNAVYCFVGYIDEYSGEPIYASFSLPSSLTTLNFGDNVQSISQMAFKDCTSLTGTLTLPNSLTTIGDQAFYNCYGFEGIVMGNSVETIGNEAFRNCGGFKGELTLPETLLSVGNNAFASCDEISTINYNAINCTEMGNAQSPVFYDCASVAHINIGANVQSIPNYAFKRCSTVVDMSVAAEVPPTIYSSTFGTVSRNIPVSVPLGSSPAYRTAQYWKEFFHITEDYSSSPYSYHWSVNVHQFGDNMTVTGIIQIDGVEQAVPYLEIGAFCNGECRGRQLLTYYPQVDRYLVFLMLYGEEGDMFTFKLYNHETNEESTAGCAAVVTFEADAILGSFMEPFVFNFSDMQLSPFSQGYNWWSTYIEQDGINGLEMLQESLGSNGTAIRSQASGYTDYYGEEYGWWGSLTSINNESSYRVITSAPCVASMAGVPAVPSEHPITLNQGWTWMGYVPSSAMDINTALDDMNATMGDVVKSQHGYSEYYAGYGWFGSLNTIEPGTGLMYYSSNVNPVTFTYPDGNRGGELKKNITAENNHWVPNVHAYPDNMTVIAVVELGDMELTSDNYELAVFAANGECRGSVRLTYAEPINRHVAFLTISGKDAAELSFRLYDTETNEEYYDAEESLDFVANAIVGEATDLYVVHFRGITGMDEFAGRVKVYPNPVNAGERFSIGMDVDIKSSVRVEIVNALGTILSVETTDQLPATIKAPDVAGVYTLRITCEEGTCYRKMVVR